MKNYSVKAVYQDIFNEIISFDIEPEDVKAPLEIRTRRLVYFQIESFFGLAIYVHNGKEEMWVCDFRPEESDEEFLLQLNEAGEIVNQMNGMVEMRSFLNNAEAFLEDRKDHNINLNTWETKVLSDIKKLKI